MVLIGINPTLIGILPPRSPGRFPSLVVKGKIGDSELGVVFGMDGDVWMVRGVVKWILVRGIGQCS